ncbi:hypothetical protein HYE67_006542 [Fusarium culmorum]|uniref:Uncharacterized protein n=1 Tax=Fusarium culmorum TaxID=5516 RepID=A0A7S8D9D0_FUSCU|nr:hypothetical protein HYE67_006542 [Fusarium culmorum]
MDLLGTPGDDWIDLMAITKAYECSDVCDTIFAIQGLVKPDLAVSLKPDYTKSAKEIQSDCSQKVASFLRNFVSGDEYQNDSCLDKFIMMLTGGSVRDFNIQRCQAFTEGSLYSLQEWRWKIRQWLNGTGDKADSLTGYWMTDKQFKSTLSSTNTATGCAKTCDGDFVRVPPESRSGDIIAVLLGSHNPIVLRPQSPSGYTVIGPCYHPGLSHGKALLGHDFKGWIPVWDRMWVRRAFYKVGYGIRRTDPRLNDVPLEDGYKGILFKNAVLGWVSLEGSLLKFAPRMSEEALKKRGVPI